MTFFALAIVRLPSAVLHAATYISAVRNPTRDGFVGHCEHCGYDRSGVDPAISCPKCSRANTATFASRSRLRNAHVLLLVAPGLLGSIAAIPALCFWIARADDIAIALLGIQAGLAIGSTLVALSLLRWLGPQNILAIKLVPWLTSTAILLVAGLLFYMSPTNDGTQTWGIQMLLVWMVLPASAIAGLIRLAD